MDILHHTTLEQCHPQCIWVEGIHPHLPPHTKVKDTHKISLLSVTIRGILTSDLIQGLNLVTLRLDSLNNMLSISKNNCQNK